LDGQELKHAFPNLGHHHGVNIGEGDQRGVRRHQPQLIRSALGGPYRKTHVVGNKPGPHPNRQDQKRNNDEVAGLGGHGLSVPQTTYTETCSRAFPRASVLPCSCHCSSTYSLVSTARPASQSVTTVMPARQPRLRGIEGVSA